MTITLQRWAGALLLLILVVSASSAWAQSGTTPDPTPTPYPLATATPTSTTRYPIVTPTPLAGLSERNRSTEEITAASGPPLPLSHRFTPQEDDVVTRVNQGVIHIYRVTDDPLNINVLLFDLTMPQFGVKSALGGGWLSGPTRTSEMALENDALAGINGDLFAHQGVPQGLTIIDGHVVMPPKHRATFAWSRENEPFIGYFTDSWTWDAEVVAANGERALLNEYNTYCLPNHICLYNEFVRFVAAEWNDVKVLLSPSGRVLEIIEGEAVVVEPGMRVLKGLGRGAEWLRKNVVLDETVTIEIETNHPLEDYTQAISGGPIIVKEGEFFQDCLCKLFDCSDVVFSRFDETEDLLCEDFDTAWKEAHYEWVYMPRTGVGFDREKHTLIVAVVDGYQLGFSRGILQEEFADLFMEFGAYEAMELDGGGSSTMVLEDEIVNNPSDDTGERWVANALLFMWNENLPPARYPLATRPPNDDGSVQIPR